ncbi:AAA family ATPase [Pseudoalteromonas umbrosa]|uniref:AAA family ATPase n=1 Tax=Pseudoalteromonas umbrosa TaxID=3048489 RepID=UPI0024C415A5|nr:AAA family ATPase [Pseudoalteromonas sp. B95]MDK1290183.1 AAA family ATPase [Pseudoalteromonas sp. B95]
MKHIAMSLAQAKTDSLLDDMTKHTRIGLTGAQRTGKTTLAEKYSEATGLPFISTQASQTLASVGFNSEATYHNDFTARLDAQNYLLDHADKQWSAHSGGFITDRTPMCMAAYTLADIVATTELSEQHYTRLIQYIDRCKLITMKHFDLLVNVKRNPAITLTEKAGSAPAKPHHILHVETLLSSLLSELRVPTDGEPTIRHAILSGDTEQGLCTQLDGLAEHNQTNALGSLENHVRKTLMDQEGVTFKLAELPFCADTVVVRVAWLHSLVVSDLLHWLDAALTRINDSPMLDALNHTLYQTVDVTRIANK